ncbi:transposase [Brasilonema bromeliae]|uniref:transposase n=1 Tax=Brasilonema bromeliae TaxID=383615 RepID=UPI0030DC5C85
MGEPSNDVFFSYCIEGICYKAIEESFETSSLVSEDTEELEQNQKKDLLNCIYQVIPQAEQRPFYLFAIDTTPYKRPYARTLIERGYIYQPNTIKGNKPINIGHSYSIVSLLPEKDSKQTATWSIPLSGKRVPISSNGVSVGSEQINNIMSCPQVPWSGKLSVLAADSTYSQRSFLVEQAQHKNLVLIARTRSHRVFYQSPSIQETPKKRGCPKKYGERFSLADSSTWHEPVSQIGGS